MQSMEQAAAAVPILNAALRDLDAGRVKLSRIISSLAYSVPAQ